MVNKLTVSPSPHVKSPVSTSSIMMNVAAALVPAGIVSVLTFGYRALLLIAVTVATCVLTEYLFCKLMKQKQTVGDLSAVVTGLLLAYNLPSTLPIWMAILGGVFAILFVKCLFGGIGDNFANPAITARIFLLIAFSKEMTTWANPHSYVPVCETVTGATPLAILTNGGTVSEAPNMINMIFGVRGGSLGETAALALIIGGVYLICKGVITATIPVTVLATVFIMSLIVGINPFYMLLSGGTLIGAFFMATDYVTSPSRESGKVIFGIGIGVIAVLIRAYASYPEGMSFAILLMNIVTPHINKIKKNPFGGVK